MSLLAAKAFQDFGVEEGYGSDRAWREGGFLARI